jgi:hypothetical protein
MKSGEEVNYDASKSTVKSKDAALHNQWKIIATFFKKNDGKYASIPNQTFPSLTYAFLIERHSAFHVAGIYVPALVLIIVNLSLSWLSIDGYERFILVGLNLFSHYIYLEELFFFVPYNGDTVPTVLLFFRDSLFVTAFLLCVTIFLKMIARNDEKPTPWIEFLASFFTSKLIFGDYIFGVNMKSEKADGEQLVENLINYPKDNLVWRTFANIIDKSIFIIIFVLYIILFTRLLPTSYDNNSWADIAVENNIEI